MPLASGTRLGPYEILAPLGHGAMGDVYRARDPRLGREVAIKVLFANLSREPERVRRFEQEARAAAALNHPNILSVYDVGTHENAPYIVSELLDGETLRERFDGGKGVDAQPIEQASLRLPPRKAVDYAVQIAHGLAAAHEKGIVHRDLKPDNVFVTTDDRVKILDFGIAKLTQDEPASGTATGTAATLPPGTQPGVVMGTIGYMSPEQLRGIAADRRSDIFSLGAILYEMLAGRRAFPGATVADAMSAILKDQPPELTTIDAKLPPILARIVERCLEKSPVGRFQSAQDLAFALAGLSASVETAAFAAPAVRPAPGRRERLVWAGVTIALVAATIALATIAYLREPPGIPGAVRLSVAAPKGVTQIGGLMIRVSPDGERLVFPATSDGQQRLWMRPLNMLDAYPLQGTERAASPFWSPDGQSLAFFADGKLKKLDLAGGPVATLCDAPQEAGGTWNADGVIVFSSEGRLHRVPATGGAATALPVDGGPTRTTLAHPLFLPDGRRFLYLDTGTGGVGEAAIYAGRLDSADRTMILRADSNVWYSRGYLFFLRDRTLLAQSFDPARLALTGDALPVAEQVQRAPVGAPRGAFSVSDRVLAYQATEGEPGIATELAWFDRSGKPLGALGEPRDYGDVKLSPDGTRAAVSVLDPPNGRDIWLFDLARGVPTAFTLDPSEDLASIWSPDGARVVFSSRRKGHDDLYEKSSGGGGIETPLLADSFDKYPLDWSGDGRFILFSSGNLSIVGNRGSLWILPTVGDKKPYPVLESPTFSLYPGQFSPDGRWIAYTSNESGRAEVYVVSFPGLDQKTRISTAGGNWPRWRRDGREIFYLSPGPNASLVAAPVNGAGPGFQVGTVRPLFQARWRPGGRYVYDVTPDGQRFLAATLTGQPEAPPITLVVNWLADLQK